MHGRSPDSLFDAGRLALIVAGGISAGLILAASIAAAQQFEAGGMGAGQDARAYWHAVRGSTYGPPAGTYGAYLYSPAFMQLFAPLLSLPWETFLATWTAMMIGALLLLAGPMMFVLVLPLAFFELWGGNIHLLLALAVVAGFRWPAAWSFVLLTKVTPGVGLLWFAARREWGSLAVALGATAAIIGASSVVAPNLWREWIQLLLGQTGSVPPPGSIAIPIGLRLPIAAVIVIYAAVADRRWLVPVGALLALPVIWWGSLSMLVAVVALERRRADEIVQRLLDRIRSTTKTTHAAKRWRVEPEEAV